MRTFWVFSISRDIALTDPPISVQESNVIENYHARQKNRKMEKGKMRKKDEKANLDGRKVEFNDAFTSFKIN